MNNLPDQVEPAAKQRRHRRTAYTIAAVALLLVVLVGGLFFRYGARSPFLMMTLAKQPWLMPSSSIERNLDDETGSLVHDSLAVLGDRQYAGAQLKARELLRSRDDYTWFNAALYLAKLGDTTAVPYLIKGLRHPAWRAHAEAVAGLQALTGQGIGNDFEAWRSWWVSQHPGESFDFEMRRQGR